MIFGIFFFSVLALIVVLVIRGAKIGAQNQRQEALDIASTALVLGPLIDGVACDVNFMMHSGKGLKGTYRGIAVTAWFADQSVADPTNASQDLRNRWSLQLWADDEPGAEMWNVLYAGVQGGRGALKFGNGSEPLQARLTEAGLFEALAPTAGYGAETMYIGAFRRVIVGWPHINSKMWPDAQEFGRRLEILATVVACNRNANPPLPVVQSAP